MIVGADGQAVASEKPVEPKAEDQSQQEQASAEDLLSKPFLGIGPDGVLTIHIPLAKVDHIVTRGLLDAARDEAVNWYLRVHKAKREEAAKIASLAAKTGYARFKDKLSGLVGK